MNATVGTAAPRSLAFTVWQLVAFDLRRFRWLALLLVTLEIAGAGFVEWTLHGAPTRIGERFGGTFGAAETSVLNGLQWVATILATVLFVQADLPSDDRAFWRTRPIAPLALAAAKLATLGLLCVAVPWLVNAVRLLAYWAPPSAYAASAVQLVVQAGAVIVPAWALAVATRTLPRFLAVSLGTIVVAYSSLGAFFYWRAVLSVRAGSVSRVGDTSLSVLLDWQRLAARGWWAALLVTLAAFGILAAYYHRRRAVAALAAGGALVTVARLAPPVVTPPPPPAALERLVSGRLAVEGLGLPPREQIASHRRHSVPYPVNLHAWMTLPVLPADVSASVFLRDIRVGGGAPIWARDAWQCCFSGGILGVVAPALAEQPSPGGRYGSTGQGFEVDVEAVDDLRDRVVSLTAMGEVRLLHHRLAATTRLRSGASVRVGHRLLEVLAIEPSRSAVLVRYAEFPAALSPPYSDIGVYVGDRARNRVSRTNFGWGESSINEMMTGPRPRTAGRHWVSRHHIFVSDSSVLGPGAELYVVESRDLGTVRTPVSQAKLQVWAPREAPETR